jgi:hypothetical protein
MGRKGVEVRSIAVAERPAMSDGRTKPTMQQLGDLAFQLVALEL